MRTRVLLLVAVVIALPAQSRSIKFSGPEVFVTYRPYPAGLALGDYDGDGRTDISVSVDRDVVTVLNQRIGPPSPQPHAHATSPLSIAAPSSDVAYADFDRDGYDDLAVTSYNNQKVAIWYGRKDYGWLTARLRSYPLAVQAADVDADGFPDIVVGYGATGPVTLARGRGTEGFGEEIDVTGGAGEALVVADANADGALDIVTGGGLQTPLLYVSLGHGNGAFEGPAQAPLGSIVGRVVGLDVEHRPEIGARPLLLVAVRSDAPSSASVLLWRFGDQAVISELHKGAGNLHAAFGDIDRDGRDDVVVADPTRRVVAVYSRGAADQWTRIHELSVGAGVIIAGLLVGDLSGDGIDDIIVASEAQGDILAYVNETTAPPKRRSVRH